MFRKFIIIALVTIASCEDAELRLCGCQVTFSDALPVQFWLANCETFNEKEVDGVFSRCFCQPFNSADEITIQFKDTAGNRRDLVIKDSNDAYLYFQQFSEVQSGLYQASLIPQNLGISNEQIQLLIVDGGMPIARFIAASSWTPGISTFDTINSTQFIEALAAGEGAIESYQPLSPTIASGTIIVIPITVTISGTWTTSSLGVNISMRLTDAAGTLTSHSALTTDPVSFTQNGTYTVNFIITATATSHRMYLRLTDFLATGTADVTLTIPVEGTPITFSENDGVLAKSDCLSIKEDHDETVLINYHNNRIFASINSGVGTPDPEFNLRIPAIFSESDERTPRESESIDLSNSQSLQVMAQIKKQRLLKIKHMPGYMHTKNVLALSFHNVTIDGLEWKLDEAYERSPGNGKFPLKTATCYLTQKNYLLRNVL